jgi:hypothetical protein
VVAVVPPALQVTLMRVGSWFVGNSFIQGPGASRARSIVRTSPIFCGHSWIFALRASCPLREMGAAGILLRAGQQAIEVVRGFTGDVARATGRGRSSVRRKELE